MEKLFVGLICLLAVTVHAQDSLYVYKAEGVVLQGKPTQKTRLQKGALLLRDTRVELQPGASIIAINKAGELFKAADPGVYTQPMLLKRKTQNYPGNLSVNYFKFIWSELVGATKAKVQIGGVFRGNILMRFPDDSTYIAGTTLHLEWDTVAATSPMFIFIKNTETEEYLKMAADGSMLMLYSHPFFSEGSTYQWSVTDEAFPNLNNLQYYTFTLITKEAYTLKKEELLSQLQNPNLKTLSRREIETWLCARYNLCN